MGQPRRFGFVEQSTIALMAARVLERLDRRKDAVAIARVPLDQGRNYIMRVNCLRLIGRVSAAQAEVHTASQAFADAISDAHTSRLPMLDVLVARDMLKH